MVERSNRSRVWIPAVAAGEFSSPESTFCADSYFGIRSIPVLLQYTDHVKDPGHSASRLTDPKCRWQVQLNTRAPYICAFEWSDTVNSCMVVWCTQNVRSFHGYSKRVMKGYGHSFRIICDESAVNLFSVLHYVWVWGGPGEPQGNMIISNGWCIPLVEFVYLVFTGTPGESYCRRFTSLLLCLCHVFRALINSLSCWFKHRVSFFPSFFFSLKYMASEVVLCCQR